MFECNPSRAHHEVECSRPAPFEGDPDAARVLRDPGNGVVEDILDVVLGGGVQDANEVTAQNLDVSDHASRVAEAVGIHDGLPLVGAIDVGHAARAGVRLPDLGHDAHALDHVPGRATNVDRLAARPGGDTRSTTVGLKPWRRSQYASVGPATLAPEMSMLRRCIGPLYICLRQTVKTFVQDERPRS